MAREYNLARRQNPGQTFKQAVESLSEEAGFVPRYDVLDQLVVRAARKYSVGNVIENGSQGRDSFESVAVIHGRHCPCRGIS